MGSRGSRTYSDNGAQSMQRSVTPPPSTPSQPQYAPRPAYGYGGYGGGFASRYPFMTGLFGGLLGAGLAGMLFGHWGGYGSPFGSALGMLLQFALIGWLIWLAVQFFRRRSMAFGGGGLGSGLGGLPRPGLGAMGAISPPRAARDPVEIAITDSDFNAWSGLLTGIQDAWSKGDLGAMRRYVTPEMLSYFSEELSRNASEGVENRVENVTLLKGDLQEAWQEGGFEYATARLRWSALDYMVRAGQGPGEHELIVAGDPTRPTEATEVWTFARSRGGHWLLSAIQQV
jgi:predicted lipid-binding transport protein (Tim44 family)